jgi:hypothetical protein
VKAPVDPGGGGADRLSSAFPEAVQDRPVPRSHALRAKLEAVGWVMVRFLRRHSLDRSRSHDSRSSSNHQYYLDRGSGGDDAAEETMHESNGNGSTPPLPHGRAAVAGAPRSRLVRDGPPSGTRACILFESICSRTCVLN